MEETYLGMLTEESVYLDWLDVDAEMMLTLSRKRR